MRERNKGKRQLQFYDNYVILDLETTGRSIYQDNIIEISALRIRNNEIAEEFSTLVKTDKEIPFIVSRITGIDNGMLVDACELDEALERFDKFIGNDILIGHNIGTFDLLMLYDLFEDRMNIVLDNDYVDTLYLAQNCVNDIENYKLETLAKYFKVDYSNAHRALADCHITKQCYDSLRKVYEKTGFCKYSNGNGNGHSNHKKWTAHYNGETKALQEMQLLLSKIVADDKVTEDEAIELKQWLDEHIALAGNYPFDKAYKALNKVLEDGVIEQEELEELLCVYKSMTTENGMIEHIENISLTGKHFCLTGDFDYGSKDEVTDLLLSKNAECDKSVKKTTDYVIVGAQGSPQWKCGNFGGKIKKAMEYKSKGCIISIISEEDFFKAIDGSEDAVDLDECSQIQIFDSDKEQVDWKNKIHEMLEDLIHRYELPEHSLYLAENRGRTSKKITSYSVCIYEPEFPKQKKSNLDQTRNSIVLNIKENDKLELMCAKSRCENIDFPEACEIKELKSDDSNYHIIINKKSDELVDYICKHTEYSIEHYVSKASSFGCCDKFIECSDAKKCVHSNKFYSKACMYRRNLDEGKIFYGKNKNID